MKLSLNDSPKSDVEKVKMAKVPYSSAVGSLMYAMICTRPYIAYAVGVVSRYMSNLGKKHWEAVTSIMRYLNDASHILGMRIVRDRDKKSLCLSQDEYIDKVLKCFNMERGKALSNPLSPYMKLFQNDCPKSDVEKAKMAKVP